MKHIFRPQSICYGREKIAEVLFVIYRFYISLTTEIHLHYRLQAHKVGLLRIELRLHAPKARVLPLYYSPLSK